MSGEVMIIPTTVDGGGKVERTASARIRALWPSRYWSGATLYTGVEMVYNADIVLFQKAYYSQPVRDVARKLRELGKLIALDLCDPVWMQGGRGQLKEMLGYCDFAVASTEPIREYLARFVPAYVIPDRLDLAEFPQRWSPVKRPLVQAAWYGYSANYDAVEEFLPVIAQHGVMLTTVSDKPFPNGQVGFIPWNPETINDVLCKFDLVINPKGSAPRYRYKSDNKTIMARAMGVPVAMDAESFALLAESESLRAEESAWWLEKRNDWSVAHSVEQWQALIAEYKQAPLKAGERGG